MVGSPMSRRELGLRALVFFAVTGAVVLAGVSFAAADPGGWAAWRVALAAWPIGAMFGVILACVPPEMLGVDRDE